MSEIVVTRFAPEHIADFHALHSLPGRCFCVAWWVETWDGWGQRTPDENRALRERLIGSGTFDGYLAYDGDIVVGWCQVLPRDRLPKIRNQFHLEPDDGTWAIGCFLIHPEHRRRGVARRLLTDILEDLPGRGARRVEAYPKRVAGDDDGDLWNGPEALLRANGFVTLRDDPVRPVLVRDLA